MAAKKVRVNPGDEWIGVICQNPTCQMPILIGPLRPEMLDDKGVVVVRLSPNPIKCLHCQTEAVYRTEQTKRFRAQQVH
jgi:hypothetical protein